MPDNLEVSSKEPSRLEVMASATASDIHESLKGRSAWRSALLTFAMLYIFIAAINMMSGGLKVAAADPATDAQIKAVFAYVDNPLAGFSVGLLLTALVQSSSFTTSMLVMLVSAGGMTIQEAVPVIMGANIGTSITAIIVSMGHIRRRREFRRAMSGAATHSIFKLLTACILLPAEMAFGFLSRCGQAVGAFLDGTGIFTFDPHGFNPVKMAISPVCDLCKWLTLDVLGLSNPVAGATISLISLVALFVALFFLVIGLKGLLMRKVGDLFQKVLFARAWTGFFIGIFATAIIQSSSVTTSLAAPLMAAGVLKLRQVYPYILGADIGTTVTACLAALAAAATCENGSVAALGLSVAAAHLTFNLIGVAIFWPLNVIPMSLGAGFARAAAHHRVAVLVTIVCMFFVVPAIILITVALIGR